MYPTIAIQGFEGSFHQVAARRHFGVDHAIAPCATFGQVVRHVAGGTTDFGLMAIENSLAGSILPNYSLLQRHEVHVIGEVYLHIRQHLMALPGQHLHDLHEVHSHPMALLQCADYLGSHGHWRLVETEDTALSAQRIREHRRPGVAAVAGALAAELFDLEIVAADIHADPANYTRFLVLERGAPVLEELAPTVNKASLYFHTSHAQGSLVRVLAPIAQLGINLSKLQSYPRTGRTWQYGFHVDVEFDTPAQLAALLYELRPLTEHLEVLGAYHRDVLETVPDHIIRQQAPLQ
ncbi:prephenate dehydratase [Hymenobacter aerilatus]|uniref:prephenate dehydratase n=1 Tax=Hymenobacter aerilatus TaxID=2932251 RepID=A0A8T9STI9_9BACT|nr:prephenate dehydratase domain-containing protein [Hymenobacter aerilatus]UOR05057.1 prephenate dehydratase [Hymenobacter aerilatus]